MAAKVLDDIDAKFCQCCVCFEQYKEPRQLPCLHRYCTECLDKMINKDPRDFKCPLCQEEIIIPENGVDGFKKDFYMKEIIDYIQLKLSLKDDKVHICGDCSKKTKSSAYCFKCTDFLCSDCHEYHLTRKSLQEHRSHILSVEDVETKNITLENFSILKEAPWCQTHPQNRSQLCCKTCANRPVCLTCTYGNHKNHDMHDIIEFAKSEREKLKQQLKVLHDCKDYPEVEQLAIYTVRQMREKNLIKLEEKIIAMKDILPNEWDVLCITCAGDVIVMIGFTTTMRKIHITVIDMNGNIINQHFRHDRSFCNLDSYCYCAHLKEFKVAVVNTVGKITLYDRRGGGSSITKPLCGVIGKLSTTVTCIAADNVRCRIFMGTKESRNLYVLDYGLNYCSTLKLPEKIKWPRDIAVHEKKIFVCDTEGMSACAVNMHGALLHEFDKPGANNYNVPVSVTTDNDGSIYILWRQRNSNIERNAVIVKYDPDDYNINLEAQPICSDERSLSVRSAEHGKTQKLVITGNLPEKIYVYGIGLNG